MQCGLPAASGSFDQPARGIAQRCAMAAIGGSPDSPGRPSAFPFPELILEWLPIYVHPSHDGLRQIDPRRSVAPRKIGHETTVAHGQLAERGRFDPGLGQELCYESAKISHRNR